MTVRADHSGNLPFHGLGPIEGAGEEVARAGFEVDLLHREISPVDPAVNDGVEWVAIRFREETHRDLQVMTDLLGARGPLVF